MPMEWWNYWIPMATIPLESMDIVSSRSWSHSNQKMRKSTSLSHKKPKQRRVWWTWFYHSPKFFVNFVIFQVFSILLILVFDLKSCFYVCFNLFEWSQVEENAKKFKGRNRSEIGPKTECKQSKNRGLRDFATSAKLALRCEAISQPKRSRCGIDVSLRRRPSFAK